MFMWEGFRVTNSDFFLILHSTEKEKDTTKADIIVVSSFAATRESSYIRDRTLIFLGLGIEFIQVIL